MLRNVVVYMLWIAFIIIIFEPLITTAQTRLRRPAGCELLSLSLSLNYWSQPKWLTIRIQEGCELLSLSLSLNYWSQLIRNIDGDLVSCELLSLSLSLNYWSQPTTKILTRTFVVNCFHYHYLWTTDHNSLPLLSPSRMLWIAFIIIIFELLITTPCLCSHPPGCCELLSLSLSLNYWSQPHRYDFILPICCELLSLSLSLNYWSQLTHPNLVVFSNLQGIYKTKKIQSWSWIFCFLSTIF